MKKKFSDIKRKLNNEFKKYYNDPKLIMIDFKKLIKTYVSDNELYVVFILFALINAFLLQMFTVGFKTFFIKPLFITLFVILILGSFQFLFKNKNKETYLIVIGLLFTIITTSNVMYYNWYKSFATVSILSNGKFIGDMGGALDEQVFQIKDLIFILLFAIFVYLIKNKKYKYNKKVEVNTFKNHFGASIVLLMFIIPTLTSLEKARLVSQWNREYVVAHFGIYAYQAADIVKSVEPAISGLFGYDKALKKFNEYYDFVPSKRDYKNEYTNVFEGKNVIGIHAESIQTFLIDLKINGKEVTPNLNKLAKNSIYFDNFYAQVSVGTSSDTEFTLNTSLMPTTIGTVFTSYNNRTFNSMPNLLKEKGYDTYSMHGNKKAFWDRAKMYPQLGYDTFYSKEHFEIDEEIGLGLSDKSFFRQSMEYIKEMHEKDQPFYTTMIMLTHHTPFADSELFDDFPVNKVYIDEEGEEIDTPYLEGTKLGRYIKSAHYADQALGQFFKDLEDNNILDDTIIVLYGDHDARLSSKDYRRMYNYDPETETVIREADEDERYVPYTYYHHELNRKVPLMIYTKDSSPKFRKKISLPMGMIDVMPTLSNMLGIYNKYQLGNDIFELKDDNTVIFSNGNFLTSKLYYNSQKSEYFLLDDNNIITEDYIEENTKKTEHILSLSSDLIIYDLIKRDIEDGIQVNEQSKERMTPYK